MALLLFILTVFWVAAISAQGTAATTGGSLTVGDWIRLLGPLGVALAALLLVERRLA